MATLRKGRIRRIARWPFAATLEASRSRSSQESPKGCSRFMSAVVHSAVVVLLAVASTVTLWGAGQTSFLLAPTWVYDFFEFVGPDGGSFEITGFNNHYDIVGVTGSGAAVLISGGVVTRLAVPGAMSTWPYDINDAGTVVGFSQAGFDPLFYPDRTFRYSAGIFSTLPPFPGPFPTGDTVAYGIDNHERIVGSYLYSDFLLTNPHQYAFDASPTGTVNLWENAIFFDVNDAGHVVGANYRVTPEGTVTPEDAFIIGPGIARTVSHPAAVQLVPDAVNNLDSVVGVYYGAAGTPRRSGFVWTNGKSVSIDYPGADETALTGINDAGVVAGNYISSDSRGAFFAVPRSPVNVTVNGSDGPLTLDRTGALRVDFAFKAPPAGQLDPAEVYIGVVTPGGLLWLDLMRGVLVTTPTRAFAGALRDFGPVSLINLPNASAVAPGSYTWFLLVDDDVNGVPNGVFYDLVQVTVR
jgi:hypothetical protein